MNERLSLFPFLPTVVGKYRGDFLLSVFTIPTNKHLKGQSDCDFIGIVTNISKQEFSTQVSSVRKLHGL